MNANKTKQIDIWVIRHVDVNGRHHASSLSHIYLGDGTMISFNREMGPVVGLEAFFCAIQSLHTDGYVQFHSADLLILNGWKLYFYDLGEHDEIICRSFGE